MRSFFIIYFCLSLAAADLFAQQVDYSIPQKLSGKTPSIKIIGKTNEGLLILKAGKKQHILEAYNSTMGVRWTREVDMPGYDAQIKDVVAYPSSLINLYTDYVQNFVAIYAELTDLKMTKGTVRLSIDTVYNNTYSIHEQYGMVTSENKQHITVYVPFYNGDILSKMHLTTFDPMLYEEVRWELEDLPQDEVFEMLDIITANDGKLFVILNNYVRKPQKFETAEEYIIYMYDPVTGMAFKKQFSFNRKPFGTIRFAYDNTNGRLVAAGQYTEEGKKSALGIMSSFFDPVNNLQMIESYNDYSKDLIFSITGKQPDEGKGLFSFDLKRIILRYDGGMTLITESQFDNLESYEVPSIVPSPTPSFRTVKLNYFNDVIVFSVDAGGALDWDMVLRKKQVSEDDDGFYSSIAILTGKSDLKFVYNEEIFTKANVNQYTVDEAGEQSRSSVFNSEDLNVLLVPNLGRQVSVNELVVPSFKRSYLSFVKFTF